MSIVNDALKKANKEFEFKDQGAPVSARAASASNADKKWVTIIIASLVIIASIFGSLILYKNMASFNPGYASNSAVMPGPAIQSALNSIEQKNMTRAMRSQDVAKLNGIFDGGKGKWAIVNNRIVKEGDALLGGEIVSITKDLVRIEKKDGSELTLSLK